MNFTVEQQAAIQKDGSNIIVSAGAGSGKTAVLSERVIDKLKHGIHINELLILTFTRAAADEMKYRIRKKIGKYPEYAEEMERIDSAYITTFDSFALSVLKKYHYMLNLPKDIKVTDDAFVETIKQDILDEVMEDFYKEKEEKFSKFILKYSVKNDNNIRKLILSITKKIDSFIDKEEYFSFLENKFYSEENLEKLVNKYLDLVKEKQKEVEIELNNFRYYFDTDFTREIEEIVLPYINASYDDLCKLGKIKLPNVKKGTDDDAKAAKASLKSSVDELLTFTLFGNTENIKKDILDTKDDAKVLTDILKIFYSKLDDYKLKNNIFTFGDIANLSIMVLRENEDARLELKNSFKEIMIDEYQDTNDIQETFISLISENNVYMVGDIKQSIYRFRGSNPSIFKEKYDNYKNNNGGIKIDLIKNFRSREEVLEDINNIFSLLMDKTLGGANYIEESLMVYGNKVYDEEKLEKHNYNFKALEYLNEDTEYEDYEIEIFTIIKDIKDKIYKRMKVLDKETNKLRDIKYSDFVIILDRSKYFDDYKQIFEYFNIPLTILRDGDIASRDDIYIIKNIIDLIIRIENKDFKEEFKYDLLSIGRSYLYEYTDEVLFDAIANNTYKDLGLYKDFESIENLNSMTLVELFDKILEITNIYEKINKVGDYNNTSIALESIRNMASNLDEFGMSLEEFRDYLKKTLDSDLKLSYTSYKDDVDSVKIMTIHKSKGLEFPVCYFADLDHDFNIKDLNSKFIADKNYGLIMPSESDKAALKILYKDEYIKEEISEKIRLFYVALTRAREEFIIVVPYKDTVKLPKEDSGVLSLSKRCKFNKLSSLVYSFKDYLNKHFIEVDLNDLSLTKKYLFVKKNKLDITGEDKLNVKNITIESNKLKEGHFSKTTYSIKDKVTLENMMFGTYMHEVLELTDFNNPNYEIINNSFAKEKVKRFLSSDLLKNVSNGTIYKEFPFEYTNGDTNLNGIIDLMIEYPDHIDIIDYKLKNVDDENYVNQLNGYRDYIYGKSKKKTNIYLYSIMDEVFKEL